MDPATISAISSAVGGISSLFGGKSKRGPSLQDYYSYTYQGWQDEIPVKVAAAKKAGVHPLYAIGAPTTGFSPPAMVGSDSGPNMGQRLADFGQDVSRAVGAYASREDRERAAVNAALDTENRQLQNDLLRSQIRRASSAGTASGVTLDGPVVGQSDARYPIQQNMPMGYGDTAPLWVKGKDANGDPVRVYNTNGLGDNETLQVLTSPAAVYDMVRNLGQRFGKWLGTPRYERKWYHGNRQEVIQLAYRKYKKRYRGYRRKTYGRKGYKKNKSRRGQVIGIRMF